MAHAWFWLVLPSVAWFHPVFAVDGAKGSVHVADNHLTAKARYPNGYPNGQIDSTEAQVTKSESALDQDFLSDEPPKPQVSEQVEDVGSKVKAAAHNSAVAVAKEQALQAELEKASEKLGEAKEDAEKANRKLRKSNQMKEKVEKQHSEGSEAVQEAKEEHKDVVEEHSEAQEELEDAQKEVVDVQQQLREANHKLWLARNEMRAAARHAREAQRRAEDKEWELEQEIENAPSQAEVDKLKEEYRKARYDSYQAKVNVRTAEAAIKDLQSQSGSPRAATLSAVFFLVVYSVLSI